MECLERNSGLSIWEWVLIILLLAFVAGCTSPAKKVCLETDWKKLGYNEGVRGEQADSSLSHRQSCQSVDVMPDMSRYEQGRRQGLEKYCSAGNGKVLGAQGEAYNGVCPSDLEESFKAAYGKGLKTHLRKLTGEINRLTGMRDTLRTEMVDVKEQLGYLKKEIVEIGVGKERILSGMLSEMEQLETDEQSLTLQIEVLDMDLEKVRGRVYQIDKMVGRDGE